MIKPVAVIAIILAIGGGYYGYTTFVGGGSQPAFITRELDRGDIVRTVSATGTIEPITKVIVGSQVSGNIRVWHKDFNDHVALGDVLAVIEPDRFQTALNQAEAELAMAEARAQEAFVRFKDARRERERIERLHLASNASENELRIVQADEGAAEAAWHAAQAEIKSAEARLNAATVDLDRTIIRSPIDGVVISRNIDTGQTVAASLQAPELFLIANNLERMQVNADVAESDIGLIYEGMPARFTVDAYPDRTFRGEISQIRYNANIVDGVVTYTTLIEVSNDDLALRPGMTANVVFEVARAENVVRIPNAALRFDPTPPGERAARRRTRTTSMPTIYRLESGKPVPIEVEVGITDGAYSALIAGEIQEGTNIITERNWLGERARRNPSQSL